MLNVTITEQSMRINVLESSDLVKPEELIIDTNETVRTDRGEENVPVEVTQVSQRRGSLCAVLNHIKFNLDRLLFIIIK